MRPRDSQKKKVYQAEREALGGFSMRVEDIEGFVSNFTRRAWFKRRWPNKTVILKPGRSRKHWEVVHRMAHAIQPEDSAEHGWEFCQIYSTLVYFVFGSRAYGRLLDSFKKHRVRFRRPKKGRSLTDEQRQELRERLVKARERKNYKRVCVWLAKAHGRSAG